MTLRAENKFGKYPLIPVTTGPFKCSVQYFAVLSFSQAPCYHPKPELSTNMKRILILIVAIFPYLLFAQPKLKDKKYQSLLWEISGKGLKKPSYLFGTMHDSNKLAFQLADSFYLGIRNADMVALETNPESWQEDMSKYKDEEGDDDGNSLRFRSRSSYMSMPDDYLSINTLN